MSYKHKALLETLQAKGELCARVRGGASRRPRRIPQPQEGRLAMETMRDIRNRMKSVRQTRQVTGAMKLISTSKLRKARRRLEDTLPYFDGISEAMRDIIGHSEENGQKWFDRAKAKPSARSPPW